MTAALIVGSYDVLAFQDAMPCCHGTKMEALDTCVGHAARSDFAGACRPSHVTLLDHGGAQTTKSARAPTGLTERSWPVAPERNAVLSANMASSLCKDNELGMPMRQPATHIRCRSSSEITSIRSQSARECGVRIIDAAVYAHIMPSAAVISRAVVITTYSILEHKLPGIVFMYPPAPPFMSGGGAQQSTLAADGAPAERSRMSKRKLAIGMPSSCRK